MITRRRARKPTHPGAVLKESVLDPLGLTVTESAKKLGVTRQYLSRFIHGHIPCSADMALRISLATKTSLESWLKMQLACDVWEMKHSSRTLNIKRLW
jgi:addiction module HigA family antidote